MENTDTKPTLEQLMQKVFEAQQAVKQAQLNFEASLNDVAGSYSKTFCYNGQWYQVRRRDSVIEKRNITYLCELEAEPKTWLKGPTGKKAAAAAAEAAVNLPIQETVQSFVEAVASQETVETTTEVEHEQETNEKDFEPVLETITVLE